MRSCPHHSTARLFSLRRLARSALGQARARTIGDRFVHYCPLRLQRSAEALFDYPIPSSVRAAPLLFIRIPRNASTSIAYIVYGYGWHVPHRTALFYKHSDPRFFAGSTSFAILRNPWERAVSAYKFLRQRGSRHAPLDAGTLRELPRLASFEAFLHEFLEPRALFLDKLDPVCHPQNIYVCDGDGQIMVDHLFRLEERESLLSFLAEHGMRVDGGIYHVNRSRSDHRDFRSFYSSSALIDRVADLYKSDVELFGFRFPDPG